MNTAKEATTLKQMFPSYLRSNRSRNQNDQKWWINPTPRVASALCHQLLILSSMQPHYFRLPNRPTLARKHLLPPDQHCLLPIQHLRGTSSSLLLPHHSGFRDLALTTAWDPQSHMTSATVADLTTTATAEAENTEEESKPQ